MEPQVAPGITGLMDPVDNGATLEQGLDFTLGQSLKATAVSTFVSNPAMALRDLYEYGSDRFVREKNLTAEEANDQYGHIGLSFNRPVSRHYADILAEQKRQENVRQSIDANGPQGIAASAAKFTVGLGVSALDPINVASAFIPAIGATRLAGMAGITSRTGLRAVEGAVGGFLGAAAIEPLVYAGAQARQADYDLTDSLLNITFGTGLGTGLHVLGGYVSDRFLKARVNNMLDNKAAPIPSGHGEVAEMLAPEVRENVIRTAVGQAAEGKAVDVAEILRAAPQQSDTPLIGSVQQIVSPDGEAVHVKYDVVEAADLKMADGLRVDRNAEDRGPARDMNAPSLMEGSDLRTGAPIVDGDLAITNQNALEKVATIKEAYANKYATARTYKQQLASRGVDVSQFKEPVLIRRAVDEAEARTFNRNNVQHVREVTGQRVSSLVQRVKELGGIKFGKDYVGELKSLTDGRRGIKLQLSRKDGRALDDLAMTLQEEGYLTGRNGEQASPDDLLRALEREASGEKVYPRDVEDMIAAHSYESGMARYYDSFNDAIDGDSMASQQALAQAEQVVSSKEAELDADIVELEQMLKGMGELTEAEQASLAEVDTFINNQPTIREAIMAAANCVIGN